MADDKVRAHHLVPANALERITQAVRDLGWDMSYCTEGEGADSEVIGIVMGRPYYVAEMMGEGECGHGDEGHEQKESERGH